MSNQRTILSRREVKERHDDWQGELIALENGFSVSFVDEGWGPPTHDQFNIICWCSEEGIGVDVLSRQSEYKASGYGRCSKCKETPPKWMRTWTGLLNYHV